GSGKTALADLIAAGGFALSEHLNDRSFIKRASNLIGDAKSTLTWEDGRITENVIKDAKVDSIFEDRHVQYLSQQFVDQLCSSEGLTDALVDEVERVVFQAHSPEARMGATSFAELLELKRSALRSARSQAEAAIASASEDLIAEQAKKDPAYPPSSASFSIVYGIGTVRTPAQVRRGIMAARSYLRLKRYWYSAR